MGVQKALVRFCVPIADQEDKQYEAIALIQSRMAQPVSVLVMARLQHHVRSQCKGLPAHLDDESQHLAGPTGGKSAPTWFGTITN